MLITPWTLNGLFFPPDGHAPDALVISGRPHRIHRAELADLGPYRSVDLLPSVTNLAGQPQGRQFATALGTPFRTAIEKPRTPPRT